MHIIVGIIVAIIAIYLLILAAAAIVNFVGNSVLAIILLFLLLISFTTFSMSGSDKSIGKLSIIGIEASIGAWIWSGFLVATIWVFLYAKIVF